MRTIPLQDSNIIPYDDISEHNMPTDVRYHGIVFQIWKFRMETFFEAKGWSFIIEPMVDADWEIITKSKSHEETMRQAKFEIIKHLTLR